MDNEDKLYYKQVLQGLSEELPDEFFKLAQLVEVEQLEFLMIKDNSNNWRLVYLMNDAVESFLVFENARFTGEYLPDYEGTIKAVLEKKEKEYILVVNQGEDSVFIIFFESLKLEIQCYDYGKIGHFWVEGYEYLRQLEYRIAILRDKMDYLGEQKNCCTKEERKLALLAEFPPLNYCSYPSVKPEYVVPKSEPWQVNLDAIRLMKELAMQVKDKMLIQMLALYEQYPVKTIAKIIAKMLHRKRHLAVIRLLDKKLQKEAGNYPKRSFGKKSNAEHKKQIEQAYERQKALKAKGIESEVLWQEPFVYAQDSVEFEVYVMVWKKGILNQKVEVERMGK